MDRITEAFTWPVRDPKWPVKTLVIALILLIPILGAVNGTGWMLANLERLRAGDESLAPGGFGYLGRGIRLFVVQLLYALAVAAVCAVVYVPALLILDHEGHGAPSPGLVSLGVLLSVLTFSIATLGSLAVTFLMPSLVLVTDRGGVAAGLRATVVWRVARATAANTVISGLMLIAAGLVGSLGAVVCGVGIVFSTAYSLAMQAWIVRSFELGRMESSAAKGTGAG